MGSLRHFSRLAVVANALIGVILSFGATVPVAAETTDTFLQEAGTIVPAEALYTFEGSQGQTVTITLTSDDFDPVLSLLDSSSEEVAYNDDFGGTFNSTIIFELPADDTYTVLARSFSGQGGDYDLVVRTATEFEIAYADGERLAAAEDYAGAIEAYSEAIRLDSDQSSAYLGRAQALLGQMYVEQGDNITGPQDIPADVRELVIADFEQAASLIEATGEESWAQSLREQADFLRTGEN